MLLPAPAVTIGENYKPVVPIIHGELALKGFNWHIPFSLNMGQAYPEYRKHLEFFDTCSSKGFVADDVCIFRGPTLSRCLSIFPPSEK